MRLLDKFQLKEALYCFFDRARSGCEHSASFKNVNMQTNMTARCNRPGVMNNLVKQKFNTKSFYVVESRAYSHCKRNIVLHLKKRPTVKKTRWERLLKCDRYRQIEKFTHA